MLLQILVRRLLASILGTGSQAQHFREDEALRSETRRVSNHKNIVDDSTQGNRSQLDDLYEYCLDHIRPVTSPLVLISQIQRSGGSLLSQLFDGHLELHAHPHELKIGYPKKYVWPRVDLDDPPEKWFEILFEDIVVRHFQNGYKKMEKYEDTFPFLFFPALQREIFLKYLNSINDVVIRDVFDAYMTSYFGAWLNNKNSAGEKQFITAFTPRLAMIEENMRAFFHIYPDGRLISVLRNPKTWLPSAARHHREKYGNMNVALRQWNVSTQAMVHNKLEYGDKVCILKFEDLVGHTEPVMCYLSDFLDIEFSEILLTPTFNKIPIKPNTSFKMEGPGIMSSALARHKTLGAREVAIIENMTGETYARALQFTTSFP